MYRNNRNTLSLRSIEFNYHIYAVKLINFFQLDSIKVLSEILFCRTIELVQYNFIRMIPNIPYIQGKDKKSSYSNKARPQWNSQTVEETGGKQDSRCGWTIERPENLRRKLTRQIGYFVYIA